MNAQVNTIELPAGINGQITETETAEAKRRRRETRSGRRHFGIFTC